jgi:hypothetical protein
MHPTRILNHNHPLSPLLRPPLQRHLLLKQLLLLQLLSFRLSMTPIQHTLRLPSLAPANDVPHSAGSLASRVPWDAKRGLSARAPIQRVPPRCRMVLGRPSCRVRGCRTWRCFWRASKSLRRGVDFGFGLGQGPVWGWGRSYPIHDRAWASRFKCCFGEARDGMKREGEKTVENREISGIA